MSGRLLTDYEALEAGLIDPTYEKMHGRHCPPAWLRVADAEHKATLKAVGEWLGRQPCYDGKPNITPNEIEAFKRGEMPEEKK